MLPCRPTRRRPVRPCSVVSSRYRPGRAMSCPYRASMGESSLPKSTLPVSRTERSARSLSSPPRASMFFCTSSSAVNACAGAAEISIATRQILEVMRNPPGRNEHSGTNVTRRSALRRGTPRPSAIPPRRAASSRSASPCSLRSRPASRRRARRTSSREREGSRSLRERGSDWLPSEPSPLVTITVVFPCPAD